MKVFTFLSFVFLVVYCTGKSVERVIDGNKFEEVENALMFQGDMLVGEPLLKKALQGKDLTPPTKEKHVEEAGPQAAALAFGTRQMKWGREIPYKFNKNAKCSFFGRISHWFKGIFDKSRRCHEDAIKEGMKEWEQKIGCIRFVPYSGQRDYIEFTSTGRGSCYAHVGRIGGRQVVNIDDGCSKIGTVLHELGHALGLHHEHSRPDRDEYIEILWDNIPKDKKRNFKKYSVSEINTVQTRYDYNSIMHYKQNAFAKFGRHSMRPRQGRGNPTLGQQDRLSGLDIQAVKRYYCGR